MNVSNDETAAQDSRITICLSCGIYHKGTHADVSYCFSEDHMCERRDEESRQLFLESISVLANSFYLKTWLKKAYRHSITSILDDIGRALDEIFLQRLQVQDISANNGNEVINDNAVAQPATENHGNGDDSGDSASCSFETK